MSTETANALRAAKARIDTPEKWERHDLRSVFDGEVERERAETALGAAIERSQQINRNTPHAEIMALFDMATASEEADAMSTETANALRRNQR